MISKLKNATGINRLLRAYVAVALIFVALFSSLSLAFIPVSLLLCYIFIWLWPVRPLLKLFTNYFMLFALAILYSPVLGPWLSSLLSLPVIALVNHSLVEAARAQYYQDTKHSRSVTGIGIALLLIVALASILSLLFGNMPVLLISAVSLVYFSIMGIIVLRGMPLKPVECEQVQCRMVAGSEDQIQLNITGKARFGGVLFLISPYEWLRINPNTLLLKQSKLDIKINVSPRLAGQITIKINGYASDQWGLIQVHFSLEPLLIYIIPRAKYAEWLAKKYLGETNPGAVLLSSTRLAAGPIYGLRRGLEYYSNRAYQPGDSLKNIDWKSTIKHHELISKEFIEFHGHSVIALINLSVGNEEEADKLIYWIIITSMTLARENIPTVLAAYDHENVRVVTPLLHSRQLLVQSLEIAKEMVSHINPVKYLNPPDVARLRADIGRISLAKSEASKKLADLLAIEYENLSNEARRNPATLALLSAFSKGDAQSNILIISHRNHDAIALAVNTANYSRKGNAVIPLYSPEIKLKRAELANV